MKLDKTIDSFLIAEMSAQFGGLAHRPKDTKGASVRFPDLLNDNNKAFLRDIFSSHFILRQIN